MIHANLALIQNLKAKIIQVLDSGRNVEELIALSRCILIARISEAEVNLLECLHQIAKCLQTRILFQMRLASSIGLHVHRSMLRSLSICNTLASTKHGITPCSTRDA